MFPLGIEPETTPVGLKPRSPDKFLFAGNFEVAKKSMSTQLNVFNNEMGLRVSVLLCP